MTPEEVGARLTALLDADDVATGVSGGGAGHERAVVDVPLARWWHAAQIVRDPGALGCDFFDWLSAVDELDDGFTVVAHLWSTRRRHGLLLRARVPREAPVVESLVDLYPGAAWHERETHEMFGIDFARHPGLRPLLLPPEFEGHPLRKDFVLASRVAKAWPGAKEPGESEGSGPKRAAVRPPGVPDPNEWGPLKGTLPETAPARRPARAARPEGAAPARAARPEGAAPTRAARPEDATPAGDVRPEGAVPARLESADPAPAEDVAEPVARGEAAQAEAAEQADAAARSKALADDVPAPPPASPAPRSPFPTSQPRDTQSVDTPPRETAPGETASGDTPPGGTPPVDGERA